MAKAYKKQSLGRGLSALLNDPIKDINLTIHQLFHHLPILVSRHALV